jgi:hypothetical protein
MLDRGVSRRSFGMNLGRHHSEALRALVVQVFQNVIAAKHEQVSPVTHGMMVPRVKVLHQLIQGILCQIVGRTSSCSKPTSIWRRMP